MHGRKGEDLLIPVPVGTIVRLRDAEPDEPALAELLEAGVLQLSLLFDERRC